MKFKTLLCSSLLIGATTCTFNARAYADEFGDNTPYYEDDAWYDFTEWLDGNDYNPTDETLETWDDETYDWRADNGMDTDNDKSYGYSAVDDDDWFYDYYDSGSYSYIPSLGGGQMAYTSRFYDWDNDGTYDAYSSYSDWNNDGTYEDYTYYSFNDVGSKQNAKAAKNESSKSQTITGNIEKVKQVQVRGGKHTVVAVKQNDKSVNVDLGKTQGVESLNLTAGTSITVEGPMAKVGDKSIVLARTLTVDGKQQQIDRNRREFTGNVTNTHRTKVRGTEHLMAMVEVTANKAGKIAVDLGPADKLKAKVEKGTQLTFTGVPVKVKNKQLVIAHTVKQDGETMQIQRAMKKEASASAGSTTKPSNS